MTESEVLKSILNKLKMLELTGDIIWFNRLASGKVQTAGGWVNLCQAGTPDVIVIVNCRNGKIAVLFLETKRTGVTRTRYEQTKFFERMEGKPMIMCSVINDPKQLWPLVRKAQRI